MASTRTTADHPTVGILILNWNGVELLREHLPSVVAAAKHTAAPVAVADNGSTDDSVSFLHRSYPDIQVIRLGQNHGFARGYNLAMQQVDWDLVALLNNDMAVPENYLEDLLLPFRSHNDLFATCAQITHSDPRGAGKETGRTCARFQRGTMQPINLPVDSEEGTEYVFWAGGGSALVSRDKFQSLGGFDELYDPFYYEDVDLSYRAWKHGWPILFVPRCKVLHKYQGTTRTFSRNYVNTIFARNRILFLWLNLHDRRMWLQHLLWLLYYVLSLVALGLRRNQSARDNLRGVGLAFRLAPRVWRKRRANRQTVVVGDRQIFARFNEFWRQAAPK